MAEIEFADGKHDVDEPYVDLIHKATDGSPKSVTFQEAMDRLAGVQTRDILRNAQADILREHLRQWG